MATNEGRHTSSAPDDFAPGAPRALRFGDFTLDRQTQRLFRGTEPVDLDPRAWDVLCVLIDRAGALVSKAEVLAAAWSDAVVSDAALSQAVQRLRRALGDDARQPRYVETVHRRGFRFVAEVHVAASEDARDSDAPAVGEPAVFVGREAERRALDELLRAAAAGVRQVVFVEGDPGIGKTALVNSFLAEHAGEGVAIARGHCVQQEGSVEPYLPVLEALDHLARAQPGTVDLLRRHAPTWLTQIPWLLEADEVRRVEDSASGATRARMLREMARALEVAAGARPLVVVLEDLHWADPATIDLLATIAQRTEPARLMVLCTYQPARAIAWGHPIVDVARRLWARRGCRRLTLELFSQGEVRAFLARRLAAPDLAESLAERLHARSEGNPLFLVTIVDHLVERGLMVPGVAANVEAEQLNAIPANLRGMIELHLDTVDATDLEVLEAASAAALEFRSAGVAAALGKTEAEEIEAVEKACERLVVRWHLLRDAGEETWPDGTRVSRYAFRHDLYRQVLYERLPGNRRRRFHQRIGERLEDAFATDPSRIAAELAAHFDQSGDDARAVDYFLLAARQARRRFAEREAAAHLRAALRRVDDLAPGAGRDLRELKVRVGLVLARLLSDLQRPEDEERNLARIHALAEGAPEGSELFRLQVTVAQVHILRSLPDLAQPIVERLVALAGEQNPSEQMEAYFTRGAIAMMQGRFLDASEDLTRALAIHDAGAPAPTQASEQRWRDATSRINSQLATTLLLRGCADRALDHLRRTIEACDGRIHPNYAAGRLLTVAGVLCLRGDLELAQQVSDRGLALAEEHQFSSQVAVIQPQRLWLSFERGDRDEAVERIRVAWGDYLRARDSAAAPVGPIFLVDACRMVGAVDEGLAIAARAWADTRSSGLRWYDAELERLRGQLLLLKSKGKDRSEAQEAFRRALAIAGAQGAKLYELRAAAGLLRACRRRSGETEARDRLAQVYGQFSEGFETRDLKAAAALLER